MGRGIKDSMKTFDNISLNDIFNPQAMVEREKEMDAYIGQCAERVETAEPAMVKVDDLAEYVDKEGY